MKNKTGKFLCIALIQAAPTYCMEHSSKIFGTEVNEQYIPSNDWGKNSIEISGSPCNPNKVDLTGKLCGNKKLNSQLRTIIKTQDIEQAYRIINELEAINISSTRILAKKDKNWLSEWLEKLYEIVKISGQQEPTDLTKEIKDEDYENWNTVIPTEGYLEIEEHNFSDLEKLNESQLQEDPVLPTNNAPLEENNIQETPKYETAELIEWNNVDDDNVSTEAIKDENNWTDDIELRVEEKQTETSTPDAKTEDLSKSIQYVHELDQQTREAYDKVVEAQQNLKNNHQDKKRLEETKNLVASLKNLDSQKETAIKTIESEIEKLEKQAKENKDLEPQVYELKKTLGELKIDQKKEVESRSTTGWFSWLGWFSKSK